MATALPKEASFRRLFKTLEKSKINSRGQDQALTELSVCFLANPKRGREPGFRKALADTVRWYENHRKYLDKDILGRGLEFLNEVFNKNGLSSLAETPTCNTEAIWKLELAKSLVINNQAEEALLLLKTMEERVENAPLLKTSGVWIQDWVADFLMWRGRCLDKLEQFHLAIENYSQFLARTANYKDCQLSLKLEKILNFEMARKTIIDVQRLRGFCYATLGYNEEAKSDLKIVLKKPPASIDAIAINDLEVLCLTCLCLKRYKLAFLAAYQMRLCMKKHDVPMEKRWIASYLLALCLHKNKKYVEANWILPDLVLNCQNDQGKFSALELNGYCLMEMKKYAQAMRTFNQAIELTSSNVIKLSIHFAMYKYAYDAQDMTVLTDLACLIQPWKTYYSLFSIEKGMVLPTTSVKFVIEESIQEVKHSKTEEAQNHLMFCNSVMIIKMFKK